MFIYHEVQITRTLPQHKHTRTYDTTCMNTFYIFSKLCNTEDGMLQWAKFEFKKSLIIYGSVYVFITRYKWKKCMSVQMCVPLFLAGEHFTTVCSKIRLPDRSSVSQKLEPGHSVLCNPTAGSRYRESYRRHNYNFNSWRNMFMYAVESEPPSPWLF